MTTIEQTFEKQPLIRNDALPPTDSVVETKSDDRDDFPPNVIPSENTYYSEKNIESLSPTERILVQIGVEQRELELQLQFRARNYVLESMVLSEDKDVEIDPAVMSLLVLVPEYETQRDHHMAEAIRIKQTVLPAAVAKGLETTSGFHDYNQRSIPTLAARAEAHFFMTHEINGILNMENEAEQAQRLNGRAKELIDSTRDQATELFVKVMAEKEAFIRQKISEKRVEIRVLEAHQDKIGEEEVQAARDDELQLRARLAELEAENQSLREEVAHLTREIEERDMQAWEQEVAPGRVKQHDLAA